MRFLACQYDFPEKRNNHNAMFGLQVPLGNAQGPGGEPGFRVAAIAATLR
jgi:hypothetical protein